MIERKEINEFLRLYPWNSETVTIDLDKELVDTIIEKSVDLIVYSKKGHEFLEYIRGRRDSGSPMKTKDDLYVIPEDTGDLKEWIKSEISREDLFQYGLITLLPSLWAFLVEESLKGNLEECTQEDIDRLIKGVVENRNSFSTEALEKFRGLPDYQELSEKYSTKYPKLFE